MDYFIMRNQSLKLCLEWHDRASRTSVRGEIIARNIHVTCIPGSPNGRVTDYPGGTNSGPCVSGAQWSQRERE